VKKYMYSAFDTVAEVFNNPFCEINDGTATRVFNQAMNENPNSHDFALFRVAEYNDATGVITPIALVKINTATEAAEKAA
jgi:hypothetical protein